MATDIRYTLRYVYHKTQAALAEEVTMRCKADGTDYSVNEGFMSMLLSKAARQVPLNSGKEMVVYNHLLDILEELEHGKTWS